jgi:hypothetical protein
VNKQPYDPSKIIAMPTVAGLTPAEHEDWIEKAYGKPGPVSTGESLKQVLDQMDAQMSTVGTPRLTALRLIATHRGYPSQRLLDACYGPRAKQLRAKVLQVLLGRKVTGSDREVQWNNFRCRMHVLVGAEGGCTAARDSDFEAKAEEILRQEG